MDSNHLDIDSEGNAPTYAQILGINLKVKDMPYAFLGRVSNRWVQDCRRFLSLNDFEIDTLIDRFDEGFVDRAEYQRRLSELLVKRSQYQDWHLDALRRLNHEERQCGFA